MKTTQKMIKYQIETNHELSDTQKAHIVAALNASGVRIKDFKKL